MGNSNEKSKTLSNRYAKPVGNRSPEPKALEFEGCLKGTREIKVNF
jgi:hypothetical protein